MKSTVISSMLGPLPGPILGRILAMPAQVVLCSLLVACSGSSDQAAEPSASPAPSSKPASLAASKPAQRNEVKAVPAGSAGQSIDVRFELAARPEVSKPTDLKLKLLGLTNATDLRLTVKADPKLELLGGAQASFPSIKPGETHDHTLSLRSVATGIFVVDVQLVAMIDGASRTLNYAIPLAIVEPQPPAQEGATTAKTVSGG